MGRQEAGFCFSAFRHAKRTVPACPTKPWRSREGRLDNRPALQRRLLTISKSAPVPEGRGEPSGLTMIPMTSFVEKSDGASRFFVLSRSLRAASSRPSGTGDPFLFLGTGAGAPAYSRSASPRRARFYSSAIHPASRVPAVSFLKTVNTHTVASNAPAA